mmetsp:Transcript_4169/g.12581  ORF Transcript_4169/g.12581 Transcript_4169/m.12581 type:complete len:212 (-) Transcript_4169:731-1366(-)
MKLVTTHTARVMRWLEFSWRLTRAPSAKALTMEVTSMTTSGSTSSSAVRENSLSMYRVAEVSMDCTAIQCSVLPARNTHIWRMSLRISERTFQTLRQPKVALAPHPAEKGGPGLFPRPHTDRRQTMAPKAAAKARESRSPSVSEGLVSEGASIVTRSPWTTNPRIWPTKKYADVVMENSEASCSDTRLCSTLSPPAAKCATRGSERTSRGR